MIDSWREALYPLGYAAQILFAGRFFQQWIISERRQESVVTPGFWRLSLAGNFLLMLHAALQGQFHVCVLQACNAVISWRNINLLQQTAKQWCLRSVLWLMVAACLAVTAFFLSQGEWFRLPTWNGSVSTPVNGLWHLIGTIGMVLFSSRFWVQWWFAERSKNSYLGISFWLLSTFGGALSVTYFLHIGDLVNVIGPAIGLVPYIRNIFLIYNASKVEVAGKNAET